MTTPSTTSESEPESMTTRAAHPATFPTNVDDPEAPAAPEVAEPTLAVQQEMSRCQMRASKTLATETGKSRCGIPATRRALFEGGHYLPICTHHGRVNHDALVESGATIQTIDGFEIGDDLKDFDKP